MHELKTIHPDSIPRALTKAERYRLLNEPRCAESICRDVLAIEPGDQKALRVLVLALTDQFPRLKIKPSEVIEVIGRLEDEYSRQYYTGVMHERWAKALLGAEYTSETVHGCFCEAMSAYERAIGLAKADNEDAVLRWNTCVRIIERRGLVPADGSGDAHLEVESFDDEVPFR